MPVESISGNEFVDKLLEQTPPAASQPRRGQNYNYPYRLYLKPDGTVVALQADPGNRAYYQDKGFRLLSENPGRDGAKSEVRQYLEDEFPKILKEQRDKAEIINAIRRAAERDATLNLETTFDDYSLDELREYLRDIKEQHGRDIKIIRPRRAQAREDAREAALLRGVETSESVSMEALQAKMLQGTGYDPLEQARRGRARGGTNG